MLINQAEILEGAQEPGQWLPSGCGCHHQLDGHEFEQALGVGDGQGSLACCSPRGRKEVDMTERLNELNYLQGGGTSRIHHLKLPLFAFENAFKPRA